MPIRAFQGVTPQLGEEVFIADGAMVIGDVHLGDHASVWYGSVLRGDVGSIRIGARTNIQDLSVVHVTDGVADTDVGPDCTVGHRVILHGCTVEQGCLIGMGAILLDGCVIGRGSLIGAGALVPPGKVIPPFSVVLGAPGKIVRQLSEDEPLVGLEGAMHYVENARKHR